MRPMANSGRGLTIAGDGSAERVQYPRVTLGIWVCVVASVLHLLTRSGDVSLVVLLGSLAIILFALLPAFIWSKGLVGGMPIVPLHLFALTWTFGLPLSSEHAGVVGHDDSQYLDAVATVVIYAIAASVTWLLVVRVRPKPTQKVLVLQAGQGFAILMSALVAATFFMMAVVGDGISVDPGVFGIIRSGILAITSVALFVLSYRMGRGELNIAQRYLFIGFSVSYIVMQLTTIFLVGSVISAASMLIGFIVGTRRIPWLIMSVLVVLFSVLHLGKGDMREEYWGSSPKPIRVLDLPGFFGEWIEYGTAQMTGRSEALVSQPIFERVSLVHMLLFAQSATPDHVDFLEGYSYEMIPELIVPRIIVPDKPASHEGTTRLNVHYGIQTRESTEATTVGWGLINEAWANFGNIGVAVLGCIMGVLYGWIGRLTYGAPVMSMRVFVGATFAAIALQTEFTMGVYVTVLFQSMVVLMVLLPFLRREPTRAGV